MNNELIQQARKLCEKAETEFWYVKDSRWHCGKPILTQLCDALEAETTRAEKAEAENRWIPVSERLPENGIDVLLYWSNDAQNEKYVDIERYHIDHWETLDRPWIRAISWMPLPEPPKGE
jgi:hypothetical protein